MNTINSIEEITQFCRLCLIKNQVNISIFEDHRDVMRKISSCLPVKISEEDKLPKKICDNCLYTLDLFYQFRITCMNAEKQLEVWINQLNSNESNDDSVLSQYSPQSVTIKEEVDASYSLVHHDNLLLDVLERKLPYEEGDVLFNEFQNDNNDIYNRSTSNSSDDETLDKLQKRLVLEKVLTIPKLEHKNNTDENIDDSKLNIIITGTSNDQESDPLELNQSSTINVSTNIEKTYPQNEENTINNKFSCTKCNKSYPYNRRTRYIKHLNLCHKEKDVPCDMCDMKFKYKSRLIKHINMVHKKIETCTCFACGATYQSRDYLEDHLKKHLNEYKYSCEKCGKKFYLKNSFIQHSSWCGKGIKYACDKCDKSYRTKFNYDRHCKSHEEGFVPKSFPCTECGKIYLAKRNLDRHLEWHKDSDAIFKFVCDTCGKRLTSKQGLEAHMRLHSGEKPFKCEACGKAFNTNALLQMHSRIHTKSKPFVCKVCGKAFTQQTSLTIHLRHHTGDKPYSCLICDKRFYTKTLLNTHTKTHGVLSSVGEV